MKNYHLKYTAEQIDDLLVSVHDKTIYPDATQQEHGLLSTEDKTKLDDIETVEGVIPIPEEEIESLLDGDTENNGNSESNESSENNENEQTV